MEWSLLFNSEYANKMQYISITMELIGGSLAVCDIYFPENSKRIENVIDKYELLINKVSHHLLRKTKQLNILVTIFCIALFVGIIPWLFGVYKIWLEGFADLVEIPFEILAILSGLLLSAIIFLINLGDFIRWLNKIGKGHAIAGIGLMTIMVGITGEIYQILSSFIS